MPLLTAEICGDDSDLRLRVGRFLLSQRFDFTQNSLIGTSKICTKFPVKENQSKIRKENVQTESLGTSDNANKRRLKVRQKTKVRNIEKQIQKKQKIKSKKNKKC